MCSTRSTKLSLSENSRVPATVDAVETGQPIDDRGDYSAANGAAPFIAEDDDDALEPDDGGLFPPVAAARDVAPAAPLVIPAECAGLRLDQALAKMLPQHSRARLQGWIRDGLVSLDGAPVSEPKRKVRSGETVLLAEVPLPEQQAFAAEAIALDVVFEDEHLLVINKPAGLVVHPAAGNWSGTLLNALLYRYPGAALLPRAGIVHRLDKDTSGLMVVAKTLEAQTDLVRQLQARTVKRQYAALAKGGIAGGGTVNAPIGRHPSQRIKMAVVPGGKPAVTHYRVVEQLPGATLVECSLETGRTHQIRVHLAHIGHPLVGDPVYGSGQGKAVLPAAALAFPRQALHAWRLGLLHPASGQAQAWEAPLPDDFSQLLEALRGNDKT